jgi:hypothetical protein
MTGEVETAIGEIVRVAAWSLRALDMKFGVAERAAPIVAWAEAVEGGALAALRTKTAQRSNRLPANWHRLVSPYFWRFDATGRSLLEIGPVAIDLLTLAARSGRVGRVDFTNALDLVFLSGVTRLGAKRKIGMIALAPMGTLTLCGRKVSSVHTYPGLDRPVFEENNFPEDGEIENAVLEWNRSEAANEGGESTFSLLSYPPRGLSMRRLQSSLENDAEAKYAFALSHGVQVRQSDLDYLYQLEVKTWAPTSERSRKQALY